MRKPRLAALFLLVLGLAATAALSAKKPEATGPIPGQAQAQVAIQPESGDLVPMEIQELAPETREALRRDTQGLTPVRHADGSVSVNLEGRFQSASMVQLDENGRPVITCIESSEIHGNHGIHEIPAPVPTVEVK